MLPHFQFGIDVFNQVLAWRVTGPFDVDDLHGIITETKKALARLSRGRAKILIDYRDMKNHGTPLSLADDLHREWVKLQSLQVPHCSHIAVLCNSSVMQADMEHLARSRGFDGVVRAFYNPDRSSALRQAYAFLGIETNQVVAA